MIYNASPCRANVIKDPCNGCFHWLPIKQCQQISTTNTPKHNKQTKANPLCNQHNKQLRISTEKQVTNRISLGKEVSI